MKRLSRGEKWLVLVCAVVVLGLVGVGLTRARLEAEPDWDIPIPRPTPNPNGYDLYTLAGAAIIPAVPAVDPINENLGTTVTGPDGIAISIATGLPVVVPPKNSPQYSLTRRMTWLQQNAKVSALFERAKAADSVCPSQRGKRIDLSSYAPIKQLKWYKIIAVNTAKMRGDWRDAVKNGLDLLELAGDIRRGAEWSAHGLAWGIEILGEDSLRDTPTHLTASEASHAARRLEAILATREPMAQILREEKWWQLDRLREIMRTQRWRLASTWGENASRSEALRLQFLSKRQMVDSYIRTADWYIREAEQPYNPHPVSPPEADNLISRNFNPNFEQLRYGLARRDTQLLLLLMRFALRAYRVENGFYPKTLSELVPNYINGIPKDPFGNQTQLYYQKRANSYILWSVGPNAKDDGGKPISLRPSHISVEILPNSFGDVVATPEQQPR